ncbi:MAG: MFS transporter [Hyphomonadaceae bacterium]
MDTIKADYNRDRLFWIGVLALFTAAMLFGLRAGLVGNMRDEIYAGTPNPGELIGGAFGAAFLGNAFTLFAASPLLDKIGIGNVLRGAAVCFVLGVVLAVGAPFIADAALARNAFWFAMLLQGVGWGGQESAINPMTTALYPEDKTHRLNVLHAWWPAGIVVGGLIGFGVSQFDLPWKFAMSVALLPALGVIVLAMGIKFPPTERQADGISFKDMMLEIFRAPGFLLWFGAMFLTASVELAPGQWVNAALSAKVGFNAVIVLVYVSALMFVMRHFAGPLAHRLSNPGLLWVSSLLAMIGLYMMAQANSALTVLGAATLWGTGVCFMWPTMMASVAERYPRGGSWFIGLIGSAGALAIYFVLPLLGRMYDRSMAEYAGGDAALETLRASGAAEALTELEAKAAPEAFEFVAMFPIVLLVLFGVIWIWDRVKASKPVHEKPAV